MKIVKPDTLSLLYGVCPRLPGAPGAEQDYSLSLAALAAFSFAEAESALLSEQELWQAVEQALPEEEILDQGLPKPRGEYLVYGACHSSVPVRGREILVRVAGVQKRLQVFGPRFWQGREHSKAEFFTRLPVTWREAYGGPGFPENPLGLGHLPLPEDIHPLPCVEDPAHFLSDPGRPVPPAGLIALPPHWPQRRRFMGTVDARWLEQAWPGYPRDYDHEHACAAPEDQRLPGFFQGGEPFAIHGMHPAKEQVRGHVPRLRGRLFVLRTPPPVGQREQELFRELPCRLETLWLFPELELGLVLFRGLTHTHDEECADVVVVLAATETLDTAPLSVEHYHALCLAALRPAEAASAPPPVGEPESPPVVQAAQVAPAAAPALDLAPLEAEVGRLEQEVRQFLTQHGLDYHALEQQLERESGRLERTVTAAEQDPQQLMAGLEKEVRSLEAETERFLAQHGLDRGALEQELAKRATHLPPDEAVVQQGVAELRGLAQRPDLPPELRTQIGGILTAFAQLQALEAQLVGLAKAAPPKEEARGGEEAPPVSEGVVPPPMSAPLETAEALARHRDGRGLAHCDLRRCDFSGLDLSGADLRRAVLDEVAWPGVRLTGAQLQGASCRGADLSHAHLDRADLSEAVLQGARLAECSAREAVLCKAQLQQAVLTKAVLEQADCRDADCSGADLSGAHLKSVRGSGLRLGGARLVGAQCRNADLSGSRADAGTDAGQASFRDADLTAVCWGGMGLEQADLGGCRLDKADLAKARCRGANLERITAREAVFLKADLRQARLVGANLFRASLRWADCSGAAIRNANLYGADLYRCTLNLAGLEDVLLGRTLLDPALLEPDHG